MKGEIHAVNHAVTRSTSEWMGEPGNEVLHLTWTMDNLRYSTSFTESAVSEAELVLDEDGAKIKVIDAEGEEVLISAALPAMPSRAIAATTDVFFVATDSGSPRLAVLSSEFAAANYAKTMRIAGHKATEPMQIPGRVMADIEVRDLVIDALKRTFN